MDIRGHVLVKKRYKQTATGIQLEFYRNQRIRNLFIHNSNMQAVVETEVIRDAQFLDIPKEIYFTKLNQFFTTKWFKELKKYQSI